MIQFVSIEYKNFLSAGANSIKINLNKNKSTLIVGHNGAGKSSILDALSFGLFGKPHRSVSKNQLVNSVNGKGALVNVKFKLSGHEFEIVRGIKPNKFEIWQDGSMIDQSSNARDYQKFLEQNILKLNHKSFHQIVVLGSSSFIPFMQLSTNHRREVIEDLLDINIFSKMKNILKDRTSGARSAYKDAKSLLDIEKVRIEHQNRYIEKMESLNMAAEASNEDRIQLIQAELSKQRNLKTNLMSELRSFPLTLKSDLNDLMKSKSGLETQRGEVTNTISNMVTEAKFFDSHDTCPTCSQDITTSIKADKVQTIKDSATILSQVMIDIEDELESNTEGQLIVVNRIDSLRTCSNALESTEGQIKAFEDGIKGLSVVKDKVDLSEAYAELHTLTINADEIRDELDHQNDKLLYNGVAGEMLKDTGIRTKVVREYLPAMNMLINQYLQTLDFFVSFNLDESFNETIRSRHRDTFVYANFSEGEKQRIDLSLLFAWRKIAQMKNSTNTNLLILDETFDSSLDTDGVDNLMKILYSLDDNTNTFVISHKPDLLESKLDAKIEFKKPNNFSQMIE
jgi:DNA repair exonuclease SbcCD ATPase subunit